MSAPTLPPQGDYKDAKASAKAAKAYAKAQRPWFKKKRYITLIVVGVIAAIMMMNGGGSDSPEETTTTTSSGTSNSAPDAAEEESDSGSEAVEERAPAKAVTAKQILKEFEDNEAAADAKYDGKRIAVTGIVEKIDTEIFNEDEYVVEIANGGDFVLWTVNCDDQTNTVAAKVKKGSTVTATGDFEDGGDYGIEMHGCVLS